MISIKQNSKLFAVATLVLASAVASANNTPVDIAKSSVKWTGHKISDSHWGTIKLKSGELAFSNGQLTGGTIVVDMASITVGDMADKPDMQKKLADHLKNDDFFSVPTNPEAKFVVKSITPLAKASKDATHEIVGDLTIKGKTAPLTMTAHLMTHGPLFHATAKASVDRTVYDVKYGSGKFYQIPLDKTIKDNFDLELNVYAKIPTVKPTPAPQAKKAK